MNLQFKILCADSVMELEPIIQQHLDKSWNIQGSTYTFKDRLYQNMVRDSHCSAAVKEKK